MNLCQKKKKKNTNPPSPSSAGLSQQRCACAESCFAPAEAAAHQRCLHPTVRDRDSLPASLARVAHKSLFFQCVGVWCHGALRISSVAAEAA